jgi:formate hydrogenlyase subunit 6/NADH:ubiquinone oxidoreductase subunit I
MNCIDSKDRSMDGARCVLCLGCAGTCAVGALEYGLVLPAEKAGRREFLRKSGVILASLAGAVYLGGAVTRRMFPGLMKGRNISGHISIIMPPGAQDIDWYRSNCVGCQVCVAACPAKIIRIGRGLRPELDFTDGYCQYNCTECSRACPTDALRLEDGMKQRTRIALSALDRTKCVVITRGQYCGACAELCPTRALRMVPIEPGSSLTEPVYEEEYCIGCGGCFHICPAEPNAFEMTGVTPQTLTPGIRPTDPEEYDESHGAPFTGGEFPF